MSRDEKPPALIAPSPQAPPASKLSPAQRADEYNPEMAKATMARVFFESLSPFMIVSKAFVVRHGIWRGLNHTPVVNPTGYNCSMRLSIYDNVGRATPNIDGKSFDSASTYMSSANVVINQISPTSISPFNRDPTMLDRIKNRLFGGGTSATEQPNAK